VSGREQAKESLFGTQLEDAVRLFPCSDGVRVPAPVRLCLDLIEQSGLESEQLYRARAPKAQLEAVCEAASLGHLEAKLPELRADPNLACALVKRFLRELKAPLLSDELVAALDKCDASVSDKDTAAKVAALKRHIFARMPQPNLDTFAYVTVHFYRVLCKVGLHSRRSLSWDGHFLGAAFEICVVCVQTLEREK
jgi:RalA-binding protein 1